MAFRTHKLKIKLDLGGKDAKDAEKIIRQAYLDCNCQFKPTAGRLGTSVPTLRRWLRAFPQLKKSFAEARVEWARSVLADFS